MGLDTVELIISVEKIFNLEVSDVEAGKMETVGDLHQHIVSKLLGLGRPNVNADIIFDQLRTIICSQLSVKPSQVLPEARFVQDLGAD